MATMTSVKEDSGDARLPTGVTFAGETFKVPPTHDMVKTLFDPTVRKSYLEIAVVTALMANLLVFLIPDNHVRIGIFIVLYIVWRLGYNFGIGYLLYQQLNFNRLVEWARSWGLFKESSPVGRFSRAEVKAQRGAGYNPDAYPLEFNTWLIFRKVVDLILMSDFTAFMCIVYTCATDNGNQFLHGQPSWVVATRLVVGSLMVLFNLWVKVNAHNTIKDYAWYWGDFFFRQINNEDLIFDGVFEMVPHPMYSVGYIGYYGFALIAKLYTVLCVAIFGHFLQMIFLHYIENPHIDKIYGPLVDELNLVRVQKLRDLRLFDNMKPMVGLANFNWLRALDVANMVLAITYGVVLPVVVSALVLLLSAALRGVYVLFWVAVVAKVLELVLIDVLLVLQLLYKYLTKWCLSMDMPAEKALNNWAILYNTLINMTYTLLFGYNLLHALSGTSDYFFSDYPYLRYFLGTLLILTQTWINQLIVLLIGYFGWFYGDFFVPRSQRAAHLTKAGVYRYLNNPEQIFGVCGVMGVFIMFPTTENIILLLLWVVNNFLRFNFIEKSHMIKLYGEQEVLKDSGVTKTFKKHLIPDALLRRLSNDQEGRHHHHSPRPLITETLDLIIRELKETNHKVSQQKIKELSQLLKFENLEYSIAIHGLSQGQQGTDYLPDYTYVGSPIRVLWKSPIEGHHPKDWIGLYRIVQTLYLRSKTLLSSHGRWHFCPTATGDMEFAGDQLFWEEGMYEFRYHLDGKHEVAYISEPFEIKVPKLTVPTHADDTEQFALQLRDQLFANLFGPLFGIDDLVALFACHTSNMVEVYQRVAYLLLKLTDIKLHTRVLANDDQVTIRSLAGKLINIHSVLDELLCSVTKKTQ